MEIKESKYIGSFPGISKCPTPRLPEFAFIGRSNVGKSSLINMLTGKKDLAHVSKKPGKTEAINFYLIDDTWYLIDLPGYGYAARSKSIRKKFGAMIMEYLSERPTLQCAVVLIDANVPPQKRDIEFINWLGENLIPFVIAYTKTDKLSNSKVDLQIENIRNTLLEEWAELPEQFITSAVRKTGKDEILSFIESTNKAVVG
ncbi:MAG: YihA family ribosome biogenesis GTP-binding protein [Lewinellaceae bacterium]|nr:YihA family ribosome biogenesis GTP-binding protein [Saprospiraceae bacterium]MCB9340290.1 YihA family ribosome biogenesis GTP-binding protein [Lewinellaceae bacterium]